VLIVDRQRRTPCIIIRRRQLIREASKADRLFIELASRQMPGTMMTSNTNALLLLLILGRITQCVGHGYVQSPKSRNYHAHTDGLWWTPDPNMAAITPRPEDSPQSLSLGPPYHPACGSVSGRNYNTPKTMNGRDMPPVIQACYLPGSLIELEVKLTAHHKGHFNFNACPISWDGSKMTEPDQECFDSNPLTFIEDVSATSPKAVQQTGFEGRGYIHPNAMTIRHRYLLPAGVEGDLILLQWVYTTANTCHVAGYLDYDFPSTDWFSGQLPSCAGREPERFWNCVEVKIDDSCTEGDYYESTT